MRRQILSIGCVALLGLAAQTKAELPIKVRADQALGQIQEKVKANDFAGALPWLEKARALGSEGFKLPSSMNFDAGQIYAKNGLNDKAAPFLIAYVNQVTPDKNFWEAVQLLAVISPSKCKAFLEGYLAKSNPPYYQEALSLYTEVEAMASEMTDLRNGKTYRVVKIGSQTWMAENLNYATGNSWCYDNESSNCAKWGRLYDWQTARSACPSGWHLPSDEEWRGLASDDDQGNKTSGTALKSFEMKGTNATGFNALPSGYRRTDGSFRRGGSYADFWSSSEFDVLQYAWYRSLDAGNETLNRSISIKTYGYSVRCLKDVP